MYMYVFPYLMAHFTAEGLDTGMDVSMLLQTRRSGEGFPALLTGVLPCTDVMGADVPL